MVLPFAIGFLLGFETKDITATITMDSYFGFVGTLFLAFGLTMEFPIVLVLLSKVGIITSDRLKTWRLHKLSVQGVFVFLNDKIREVKFDLLLSNPVEAWE